MWSFRRTPVISRAAAWSTACSRWISGSVQDSIAVVDMTWDEGVDEGLQGVSWHWSANWAQLSKLVEAAASSPRNRRRSPPLLSL